MCPQYDKLAGYNAMTVDGVVVWEFRYTRLPTTPPLDGNIKDRQPPSEPSPPSGSVNNSVVNYSNLRTLQEILENYSDISNLGNEDQTELNAPMQKSGMLEPDALRNATV